jgi:putative oxidoreductase
MSMLTAALFAVRRLILQVTSRLEWLPPTVARFTLGWVFLLSGWGKLHNLPKIVDFFRELGIPAPELQAPFASANELVCGALLLVGLASRIATIPLMITMVVALITAQRENVGSLNDLFGLVEYLYIALLGWIAVAGPGPLSLDALLVRFGRAHERADAAPRSHTAAAGAHPAR